MPRSIYTKLTGRRRGIAGYSQLWLGPDHLLLLQSTRIAEQYKRFAFADIQALVVTETAQPVVLQVLAVIATLAWIGMWFAVDSKFAKWSVALTAAVALAWIVDDIARGPRCRCYLHTFVSRELLTPVSRMKTAREFVGKVRPMVEAVQGVLPTEQFPAPPAEAWEPPPPEIISAPGYLPEVLFGVFLVNAVLIAVSSQYPRAQEISGLLLNTLFAELVLIPVALLRRKGRDPRTITYGMIAVSILFAAYDLAIAARSVFLWYMTFLDQARFGNRTFTPLSIFPQGPNLVTAVLWRAAIGISGLATAFYERETRPR